VGLNILYYDREGGCCFVSSFPFVLLGENEREGGVREGERL